MDQYRNSLTYYLHKKLFAQLNQFQSLYSPLKERLIVKLFLQEVEQVISLIKAVVIKDISETLSNHNFKTVVH